MCSDVVFVYICSILRSSMVCLFSANTIAQEIIVALTTANRKGV